jgi:hypothetical protein
VDLQPGINISESIFALAETVIIYAINRKGNYVLKVIPSPFAKLGLRISKVIALSALRSSQIGWPNAVKQLPKIKKVKRRVVKDNFE